MVEKYNENPVVWLDRIKCCLAADCPQFRAVVKSGFDFFATRTAIPHLVLENVAVQSFIFSVEPSFIVSVGKDRADDLDDSTSESVMFRSTIV